MKKNIYLTAFFFLFFTACSIAQTSKGVWRVNGTVNTETSIYSFDTSTDIELNPEVAVCFSDNWMAGASLYIGVFNRTAFVGQGLFIRNTFLRADNNELFSQLFYQRESIRNLLAGGGNSKIEINRIGPSLGLLHFFNPSIALEARLDYNVFSQVSFGRNDERKNGNMGLHASIQYFFNSKLNNTDTLYQKYQPAKGDWIIGGTAVLSAEPGPFFTEFNSNVLQPYIGYFIHHRILVAAGLNYNNSNTYRSFILGVAPFARYYQKIGPKKQLFAEINLRYNVIWNRIYDNRYERNPYSGSIGLGLGLSTRISPQVSFDVKTGFNQIGLWNQSTSDWQTFQRFDFCIGLQAFLKKE